MRSANLVATTLFLALLLPVSVSWANPPGCEDFDVELALAFTDHWEGPFWGFIGDQPVAGNVVATTLVVKETDDGNFVGVEELLLDFSDGDTFTAMDRFTFGPWDEDPSIFKYNAVGNIIEGTGMFQDATMRFTAHGTAVLPNFEGTMSGNICDLTAD